MGVVDTALTLAWNEAFTGDESFDDIDLQVKNRYMSQATTLCGVVEVSSAKLDDGNGNETYKFIFEQSDSSTFAAGNTTLGEVDIARGAKRGTRKVVKFPYDLKGRYIRARVDTGGTTPSGSVNVYLSSQLVAGDESMQIYPGSP